MSEPGDCLTEYVSRDCRRNLATLCVNELGDANPMSRLSPANLLANELGVTRRTVNRWLSGGIQGCDQNIEQLIEVALRCSPGKAEAALRMDLEAHRSAVGAVLGAGQGGDQA